MHERLLKEHGGGGAQIKRVVFLAKYTYDSPCWYWALAAAPRLVRAHNLQEVVLHAQEDSECP